MFKLLIVSRDLSGTLLNNPCRIAKNTVVLPVPFEVKFLESLLIPITFIIPDLGIFSTVSLIPIKFFIITFFIYKLAILISYN